MCAALGERFHGCSPFQKLRSIMWLEGVLEGISAATNHGGRRILFALDMECHGDRYCCSCPVYVCDSPCHPDEACRDLGKATMSEGIIEQTGRANLILCISSLTSFVRA